MAFHYYFDEEGYSRAKRQNRKKVNKAYQSINELNYILNPHLFIDEDSVYGENNILNMMTAGNANVAAWPKLATPSMLTDSDSTLKDTVIQAHQYQQLFAKYISNYMQHAVDKHDFASYNDTKQTPLFIDISKLDKFEDDRQYPFFEFDNDDIEFLKTFKHNAFVPCFENCVIKVNKKRYMICKLLNKKPTGKQFTYQVDTYLGDQQTWIFDRRCIVEYKYGIMANNKLPLSFNVIDAMTYEEFITKYMDEMPWNNQDKTFWYDVLGISSMSDMALINIKPGDDHFDDLDSDVLIASQKLAKLESICKDFDINLTVTADTSDTIHQWLLDSVYKEELIVFLKIIAKINLLLHQCNNVIKYDSSLPVNRDKNTIYIKASDKNETICNLQSMKLKFCDASKINFPDNINID